MDLSVTNRAYVTEALRQVEEANRDLDQVLSTHPPAPVWATVCEIAELLDGVTVSLRRLLGQD